MARRAPYNGAQTLRGVGVAPAIPTDPSSPCPTPATFPPYDVFPVDPARTPAPGTLSSAKTASREKGELILEVCVQGIADAIGQEFPRA